MANTQPIASIRRHIGRSQDEFAEFAGISSNAYFRREQDPDWFRLGEIRLISSRLDSKDFVKFANAVVATMFGEGWEVTEK